MRMDFVELRPRFGADDAVCHHFVFALELADSRFRLRTEFAVVAELQEGLQLLDVIAAVAAAECRPRRLAMGARRFDCGNRRPRRHAGAEEVIAPARATLFVGSITGPRAAMSISASAKFRLGMYEGRLRPRVRAVVQNLIVLVGTPLSWYSTEIIGCSYT